MTRSLEIASAMIKGPTYSDLTYAVVEGRELCLDLYLPFWTRSCPLVVFFHGGGWSDGTYKRPGLEWLTGYGFAVATVQYRLTNVATFPAQLHDAKGAIRWLRAHASEYGYDAGRIGTVGFSSGAHLAMMAGLAQGDEFLEGVVGGNLEASSVVNAVVDYYGATDFILRAQSQPEQTEKPGSVVYKLLGSAVSENESLARQASPACHVGENAPPLFVIHGEQDPQVLVDQARRIVEVYREQHREVTSVILPEGGHGGADFFIQKYRDEVAAFLSAQLK
ncbi:alpha/beta hydrolase [Roseibacillus persicicus]|uniref:alpha/beta hydrolase fold domain-containing protein n=1 Tax=Roseibacillus persicicus TaxID=454148 RepID=UPI00398A5E10